MYDFCGKSFFPSPNISIALNSFPFLYFCLCSPQLSAFLLTKARNQKREEVDRASSVCYFAFSLSFIAPDIFRRLLSVLIASCRILTSPVGSAQWEIKAQNRRANKRANTSKQVNAFTPFTIT